jgi:hypothetical protein
MLSQVIVCPFPSVRALECDRTKQRWNNLLWVQLNGLSISLDNGLRMRLASPVCPFGQHEMSLQRVRIVAHVDSMYQITYESSRLILMLPMTRKERHGFDVNRRRRTRDGFVGGYCAFEGLNGFPMMSVFP